MLKKTLLTALALMTFIPTASSGEPLALLDHDTVKDRFVSNPRPVKDIGDPHILREGDEYFAFATGGPICSAPWARACC